ncbi:MAG: 2-octaprenyl-6-methoxyphenyl hydroxylase [Pseudohongiellaceae bacterium]
MQIDRPRQQYDITVVGAGMVGACFARLLSETLGQSGYSILAVEAVAPAAAEQPSFDARSTALSWGSRKIFQRMGLWAELQAVTTPIREIRVSDQGHFGSAQIDCREHGQDALGYVVENRQLGALLNPFLQASPALDYLAPARISAVRPRQDGMELDVEQQDETTTVSSGLVVLADGGRSPICSQLGIEQQRKAYGQQALIANIAFSEPHGNVAYERFTDSGPLAVLPLNDFEDQHRGSLVWTLTEDEGELFTALADEQLLDRLNARFGRRLGVITGIGARACYPLHLTRAREQIRPHLVLLGNVAHTLHPVAGQGLNLALRAVDDLVDAVAAAHGQNLSPGTMAVLEPYRQRRESDQQTVVSLTDQMISLFSNKQPGRVALRKAGLLAIDLQPGLRRGFARQAMGLNAW